MGVCVASDKVPMHATVLVLLQEHPELRDYLCLPESKPTLSRAEFFSQLDDALQANDGVHLQLLLRRGVDLHMRSDANDTIFHRAVLMVCTIAFRNYLHQLLDPP